MISDFEFLDNFWNVQVPPNLRPIEGDDVIRPLLMFRVELTARLGMFGMLRSRDEAQLLETKAQAPKSEKVAFSAFFKCQSTEKKPFNREETGSLSKVCLPILEDRHRILAEEAFLSVSSSS